jgi:hypothetical protein
LILVLAPNPYFEGTAYHELAKGNEEAKKNKLSDATWMLLLFTCIEEKYFLMESYLLLWIPKPPQVLHSQALP